MCILVKVGSDRDPNSESEFFIDSSRLRRVEKPMETSEEEAPSPIPRKGHHYYIAFRSSFRPSYLSKEAYSTRRSSLKFTLYDSSN